MLSRLAPLASRASTGRSIVAAAASMRAFSGTIGEAITAGDAAELSGYSKIDFSISEDAMVIEAVQKFAAFSKQNYFIYVVFSTFFTPYNQVFHRSPRYNH
jgi:hypothetical protein